MLCLKFKTANNRNQIVVQTTIIIVKVLNILYHTCGGTCTDQIFEFFLVLQNQMQTLPIAHSNNSKIKDKIILLIISILNTLVNNIH